MSGVIPLTPKLQFFDAEGVPLAGGFVNVYLAGSTARTNTWADEDQTTENTNPIELDANGSCSMYVDPALTYKWTVTDANGVSQPHCSSDNILVAGSGATLQENTIDRFSGTGAQTAFTLSVTPSSEDDTLVYVAGVYQQKNTYSLSGATLTFAVAPASGTNNIEVVTTMLLNYTGQIADAIAELQSELDDAVEEIITETETIRNETEALYDATVDAIAGAGGTIEGDITLQVSSIAVLKALTEYAEGTTAYVTETGKAGKFVWRGSVVDLAGEEAPILSLDAAGIASVSGLGTIAGPAHENDTGTGFFVTTAQGPLVPLRTYWTRRTNNNFFTVHNTLAGALAGTDLVTHGSATLNVTYYRHKDPYEGIYVIPNGLNCDGSQGAWVRQWDTDVMAEWFGVSGDLEHNQAILNTTFQAVGRPATIWLPAAVLPITRMVWNRYQEGIHLTGFGGLVSQLQGDGGVHVGGTGMHCVRMSKSNCMVTRIGAGGFTGQLNPGSYGRSESTGIQMTTELGVETENMTVRDCYLYDIDTGVGINCNAETDAYYPVRNAWVQNNHMENIHRQGVELFVVEKVFVTGNKIRMQDRKTYNISRGVRVVGSRKITVSDNDLLGEDEDFGSGYGVEVTLALAGLWGANVDEGLRWCHNVVIHGNRMYNFGTHVGLHAVKGPCSVTNNHFVGYTDVDTIAVDIDGVGEYSGALNPGTDAVKFVVDQIKITGNHAHYINIFCNGTGRVNYAAITDNKHLGCDTATSRFMLYTQAALFATDLVTFMEVSRNVSICKGTPSGGNIRFTGTKAGETIVIEDNKLTPSGGSTVGIGAPINANVLMRHPNSNRPLDLALWTTLTTDMPEYGDLDSFI